MPQFKFLSLDNLANNLASLKAAEVKKYYNNPDMIPKDRKDQLDIIEKTMQQLKLLSIPDLEKSQIFTGLMLDTKSKIGNTYWGPWKLIATPDNSTVYKGIDAAIGISETNLMDDESKNLATNAFKKYTFIMEQITTNKVAPLNVTNMLNFTLSLGHSLDNHQLLMPQFPRIAKPDMRRIVSNNELDYLSPVKDHLYIKQEEKEHANKVMKFFNLLKKELGDEDLADKALSQLTARNKGIDSTNSYSLHMVNTKIADTRHKPMVDFDNPMQYLSKDEKEKLRQYQLFAPKIKNFDSKTLHPIPKKPDSTSVAQVVAQQVVKSKI